MDQARVVVTLVQILKDTAEDLRFLCGQVDASISGLEELRAQEIGKERAVRQHILMRSKEPGLIANDYRHDGTGKARGALHHRAVLARVHLLGNDLLLLFRRIAKRSLRLFGYLARSVFRTSKRAFTEHFGRREGP